MAAESGSKSPNKGQSRKVEFAGRQVNKELEEVPGSVRNRFLVAIEQLTWDLEPGLVVRQLNAAGDGVAELKINGRPAYRLVFTSRIKGTLLVLAVRAKTSEGTDRTLIDVARKRLKAWLGAAK